MVEDVLREKLQEIEAKLQDISEAIDLQNMKQPCKDIPVAIVVLSSGELTVTRKDAGFMLRIINRDSNPKADVAKDVTTDYFIDDVIEYEGE